MNDSSAQEPGSVPAGSPAAGDIAALTRSVIKQVKHTLGKEGAWVEVEFRMPQQLIDCPVYEDVVRELVSKKLSASQPGQRIFVMVSYVPNFLSLMVDETTLHLRASVSAKPLPGEMPSQ
ncbi:MAG: hypothetical protein ACT4OO_04130 [Nitrospiraceae bacterium]